MARREERYIAWLERLEIPTEVTTDYERFSEYLVAEFDFEESQIDALWETLEFEMEELYSRGIRPVLVEYPWGSQLRFAIQGRRGLFGWERVKKEYGISWLG